MTDEIDAIGCSRRVEGGHCGTKICCRVGGDQVRQHAGKGDDRSGREHDDHGVVFNVVAGVEGVVPMIEEFGDMSPDAERQDQ